jgi:hypothetical protein
MREKNGKREEGRRAVTGIYIINRNEAFGKEFACA